MNIFFYFIIPFSCQNLSSIHAFVLHTKGLQVDADYIPQTRFFSLEILGADITTSIQRPPVLCDLFSELPSMVAIDKFDCILYLSCNVKKPQNNYQIVLMRIETNVVLIVFRCCPLWHLHLYCYQFLPLLSLNQVSEKLYLGQWLYIACISCILPVFYF